MAFPPNNYASSSPGYSAARGTSRDNGSVNLALDNMIRNQLKVGDPRNPKEVAAALATYYQDLPIAAAIQQEAQGLPFLLAPPTTTMLPAPAATSSDREFAIANNDVERALTDLSTNALTNDIIPEMQGWAQAAEGDLEEGLAMMKQGMDTAQKVGVSMFMPFLKCRMAEILLSLDQVEESERIIADAEAIVNRTGERNYEGELRRLKGELYWRNGRIEEAESQFCDALDIARRQKAKILELRAAISYARFLAARGEPDRACAMVSNIAAWFDEGRDGHDLVAAEAAIVAMRSVPQAR